MMLRIIPRRHVISLSSKYCRLSTTKPTPHTPHVPPLPSTLLGVVAGSLSSLIGLGGGFILTPALTSTAVLKRALLQHEAQATTLASIVFSSVAASCSYLYAKRNDEEVRSDEERRQRAKTGDCLTLLYTIS